MPMEETCQPVQLEPFIHQVGGHSSMLCLDESTVCKPLIPQELHFYTTLPPDLARFTPKYKGVIEVCFLEDKDGYITLTAYPPECRGTISCDKKHTYTLDKKCPSLFRIRLRRTDDVEIESPLDEMFEELETEHRGVTHNPWVLKCHRDQLKKMDISGSGYFVQKFILLENLTLHFTYPCILDLKMGVRQHGDDATPAKRQRQEAKVAMSTSGTLGVRICGMQVYQHNLRRFVCRNKYYGRSLTEDGFRQALIQFLHNGIRLRTDLVQPIVELLNQLVLVLEKQHFRFYTSSLLIIYDGCSLDDSCDELDVEVELDFEDSSTSLAHAPRTQLSDLQISTCSNEAAPRSRKLGSTINVEDLKGILPPDVDHYVPLISPKVHTTNDRKRTPPTRQDVDDRMHSSPTQIDMDYRKRTSKADVDDRRPTPPPKPAYHKQMPDKSDIDDRRTPPSSFDTDERRQSSPIKSDIDDRRRTSPARIDIDERDRKRSSPITLATSPHRLLGIDEHRRTPPPHVSHGNPTHSTDDHSHAPRTDGKLDSVPEAVRKRNSSPEGGRRRDSSSGVSGKRDSLSGLSGRRDSLSGVSGRRDSLSGVSGRRDSSSGASGKRDSLPGVSGKRDSLSGANGRRDSLPAASERRDSYSGKHDSSTTSHGATSTHTHLSKSSKVHEFHRKSSSSERATSESSSSDHTNGKTAKHVTVIPRVGPLSDRKVDVRMIDFAHSTHSEVDGGKLSGPDRGYIFGLLNVIRVLNSILDEDT